MRLPIALLTLSLSSAIAAQETAPVPATAAVVVDAYDGDTLTVTTAPWPDWTWNGSVRVLGVDTPEIRGDCDQEERWAVASRDYVRDLLLDESVMLTGIENDKYGGRVLATVTLEDGRTLDALLIEGNYGRAYDGGTRGDWCGESLVLPSDIPPAVEVTVRTDPVDPYDDPGHPLYKYDDNRNGRISCAEARAHGIAPVYEQTPDVDGDEAYDFMSDPDGDGVVCEAG